MDEQAIRSAAEAHAQAVVDGEMDHVTEDVHPHHRDEVFAQAAGMPDPVRKAEVVAFSVEDDRVVADLRYVGDTESMVLRSIWTEIDGRPQIIDASVVA